MNAISHHPASHRSALYAVALSLLALVVCLARPALAEPDDLDAGIRVLQHSWEVIQYQTPEKEHAERFEKLADQAHALTARYPDRAEPHIWEGIVLSSWAGARGGIGALGLAKRAKASYERALTIDETALKGSALNSLGVLYYKVPGWPIGFGDKDKAEELLRRALAINPDGIDPNYFYADYLVERNRKKEAIPYLEKALAAPARPGREIADQGRREEAQELLDEIRR
ncbi:MAG: hypothetical protein LBV36_08300 [Chromatiales bacterium]|jgi:tetratricopeptide (TPR) repeat protein|nr:hypothetical protein [Chromatiales bacterium]